MSNAVRPFTLHIDDAVIADLHRRLDHTRWPERETVDDWSQGTPLAYVQAVCRYWREQYDWRERERRLNRFPQFLTTLDDLPIHFIHQRSPHPQALALALALALLITHGWPGSVVEFHKVIGPLVDPVAHGDNAEDAFHVVCPTLPGYGFSGKPVQPGWGVGRIAEAWNRLMLRLGAESGRTPMASQHQITVGGSAKKRKPLENPTEQLSGPVGTQKGRSILRMTEPRIPLRCIQATFFVQAKQIASARVGKAPRAHAGFLSE